MKRARKNDLYTWMETVLRVTVSGASGDISVHYEVLKSGPAHHFAVGHYGMMDWGAFYKHYHPMKNCIECGKSRIRYVDCDNLAVDGQCWSCCGNCG